MKNAIRTLVAGLALASGTAQAAINITWIASGGFYQSNGTTPLLQPATKSTIVELISCGVNNTKDAVNLNDAVNYLGGDDVLLARITFVNSTDNGFDEYAAATYGTYANSTYSSFNFYARIFQDNTPAAGEYYFDGAVVGTQNVTAPATQLYDINGLDGVNGSPINQNTIVAVPEPATFAFLGIGGMLLAVRRFRRS